MLEMKEGDYPERRHLLTDEDRANLPDLYELEGKGLEAQALLKFVSPENDPIWYAVEFDGEDLFYGLIVDDKIELCYFSLQELETAEKVYGFPVDTDDEYVPQSLREIMEFHKSEGKKVSNVELNKPVIFEKLKSYAEKISTWDNGIIEVVGVGSVTKETVEPTDPIELICVYAPEPKDDSDGFFLMVNLAERERHEGLSELLQIPNDIDFGYEMEGRYYLNGKIMDKPENRITIWRKPNEREFDK